MVITKNESGASVACRITCLLVTTVVFGDDCEVNFDDKVIENSIHNSSLASFGSQSVYLTKYFV